MYLTEQRRQDPKSSSCFYLYCLGCSIFIATLLILTVVIWLMTSGHDLHVELDNKVNIFPDHFHMGDVIVRFNDEYGIIDAKSFELEDAHVVCKQRGYPEAIGFTTKGTFGFDRKPDFVIEHLDCRGHENNINKCHYKEKINFDPYLTKLNVAGVICSRNGTVF